jgi:hypothetical protein
VKGPPFFLVGGSAEGKGGFFSSCVWCEEGRAVDAPKFYDRNYKMYFVTILVEGLTIQACLAKGHFAIQKNLPQGYHNISFQNIHLRH